MPSTPTVVVTSISPPNAVLRALSAGSRDADYHFLVIGDVPSPRNFQLEHCAFWSLKRQEETGFRLSQRLPKRHYSRKNLGYLLAIQLGSPYILETDDDNYPGQGFWKPRSPTKEAPILRAAQWTNVYRYFTDLQVWPRGFPLDAIHRELPAWSDIPTETVFCPIQQGLADENPDVDAIYRLVLPLPISFRGDRQIALGRDSWCPFNSQNTTWFPEAYPLLYLPSYCSFRMTDIWRSYVAQRIAWEYAWSVLFHSPTVRQDRNEHDLMLDFKDEVTGYLENRRITELLAGTSLSNDKDSIAGNLFECYRALVEAQVFPEQELDLLQAWLYDLKQLAL